VVKSRACGGTVAGESDVYGGLSANVSQLRHGGDPHTLAVAAASGGTYPWEGSSAVASGSLNTGNGNKLTTIPLFSWKTRGGEAWI
jgi:hypothetical protein